METAFRWQRYFQGTEVALFPEMTAVIICERFGWTWQEYEAQPWVFIQSILEMMHAENRVAAKQNTKQSRP